MNCPKCQAPVPNGATVCPTCGERMAAPASKPANKNKILIPIIAGGSALLVILIVVIAVLAGGGQKAVISKYFKAYQENDAEKLFSVAPQIWVDNMYDADDDIDESDLIDQMDNRIDNFYEETDSAAELTYEIVKSRKVDKEIVAQYNEYLKKYSYTYKDIYNEENYEVTSAYIFEVRRQVEADGKMQYNYVTYIVVKENGKWKLLNDFMLPSTGSFSWDNVNDLDVFDSIF